VECEEHHIADAQKLLDLLSDGTKVVSRLSQQDYLDTLCGAHRADRVMIDGQWVVEQGQDPSS
jgi:hypothetical protein